MTKTAQENAARYYELAKKYRQKAEGAAKAIGETEKKLAALEKKRVEAAAPKKKREREWYEKFRWFFSSSGMLVLGGRDATQNEVLVAKHLEPNDLFFHADVHGAPAVVVKNGAAADAQTLAEAAQFSVSNSSAWKAGYGSADAYAVTPQQVSKHAHGEYVPKGGFIISGARRWFRGIELRMRLGVARQRLECMPAAAGAQRFVASLELKPGGEEKGALAKKIRTFLSAKIPKDSAELLDVDEIVQLLPPGRGAIVR
jgi:predicted ribosome quality control (RQC) complex YloA/Tae2 family protein